MKRPRLRATFYETYYFASVIRNLLHDRFGYLRRLHEFYGDGRQLSFTTPFPRFSAFHSFAAFVVDDLLVDVNVRENVEALGNKEVYRHIPAEMKRERQMTRLPIEQAFAAHGIRTQSFAAWLREKKKTFANCTEDDVDDYITDLRLEGPYDELVDQSAREVFFIAFANRGLMLLFNDMMASALARTTKGEIEGADPPVARYFRRPGVLKRVQIPRWAREAVFYRDRGRCVFCSVNLSGLVEIYPDKNFDHMVPLVAGGLNDVTNLQLSCGECNRSKSGKQGVTSTMYEDWYLLEK